MEQTLMSSLLSTTTVDREIHTPTMIMSMAVSRQGAVAYCSLKLSRDSTRHTVNLLENGKVRTVIPAGPYVIGGLSFVQVAGKEQLIVSHGHDVILVDPGVKSSGEKRHLATVKLDLDTPLFRSGDNKVLYVQPSIKIRQLEVTSEGCNDTLIGELPFQWEHMVWDLCVTDGILVVTNGKDDQHVVGIGLADMKVKWRTLIKDAQGLCPGPKETVFVCCAGIKQLSLHDGTVIANLPLATDLRNPRCISYQNGILTVAHVDRNAFETEQLYICNISKYQLTISP